MDIFQACRQIELTLTSLENADQNRINFAERNLEAERNGEKKRKEFDEKVSKIEEELQLAKIRKDEVAARGQYEAKRASAKLAAAEDEAEVVRRRLRDYAAENAEAESRVEKLRAELLKTEAELKSKEKKIEAANREFENAEKIKAEIGEIQNGLRKSVQKYEVRINRLEAILQEGKKALETVKKTAAKRFDEAVERKAAELAAEDVKTFEFLEVKLKVDEQKVRLAEKRRVLAEKKDLLAELRSEHEEKLAEVEKWNQLRIEAENAKKLFKQNCYEDKCVQTGW